MLTKKLVNKVLSEFEDELSDFEPPPLGTLKLSLFRRLGLPMGESKLDKLWSFCAEIGSIEEMEDYAGYAGGAQLRAVDEFCQRLIWVLELKDLQFFQGPK